MFLYIHIHTHIYKNHYLASFDKGGKSSLQQGGVSKVWFNTPPPAYSLAQRDQHSHRVLGKWKFGIGSKIRI